MLDRKGKGHNKLLIHISQIPLNTLHSQQNAWQHTVAVLPQVETCKDSLICGKE